MPKELNKAMASFGKNTVMCIKIVQKLGHKFQTVKPNKNYACP